MKTLPSEAEMYQALRRRDRGYDGIFVVGVKTTGIFCRPTCFARKPLPENVEYFASANEALLAGYRPCRRCRPLDNGEQPPQWVESLRRRVDRAPTARVSDADLRAMSIDPHRARRYFKRHYGMTFHAYHRARRMGMALREVRDGRDLTEVGFRHGYGSASGFRYAFARVFGGPPGRHRQAGCLYARWLDTPLGAMVAVAGDDGLCLLEFVDRRGLQTQISTLRRRLNGAIVPGRNAHLDAIADQVGRYFEGTLKRFTVPLVMPGTPFQVAVWRRLQQITYGHTSTYSQLANELDRPGASRAVGRANGDNRLAIVVPCHRVVRADGNLCGYGGGLWRKKWLLEHERGLIQHREH
ncbi:MAG: bifunctional transcriptional activator/DNA repair enzyme AdaA [Planctomycetota bacterium]|jgi:AraC family transcriptional regulator of adaptative response/methylated-DNA-[protein]-cysteine methyltransferase